MPGNFDESNWTMRKYQQLALTLVAFFSCIAFLFYKHEYERLRYTLEYLDTFGEPPSNEVHPQCGYGTHRVSTPPADWVRVTPDLQVYSAYWDQNEVRVIGAVKSTSRLPSNLGCLVWFEDAATPAPGTCRVELTLDRPHGHLSRGDSGIVHLLCKAHDRPSRAPYMIQFVGSEQTQPVFIHAGETKPPENSFAICLLPSNLPTSTLRMVEFVAHHNIVGAEKFVIYGPLLTPLARRLLDQYGDQMGLEYEEKSFAPVGDFEVSLTMARRIIELDCLQRHRNTHENILVLGLDEYVILEHKVTLQDTLLTLGGTDRDVAEFHLTSQAVCLDRQHSGGGALLLSQRVHTVGQMGEEGVAILRPVPVALSAPKSQHVSAASAVIHRYSVCSDDEHGDRRHLPVNRKAVGKIEKSLLYRKWIINH